MQIELKRLQRDTGITFVFVTHDQEEALTMSDRLAVLHAGKVVQVGTPSEVYSQPATSYVATFLGTTNLFSATVTAIDADALTCTVAQTTLSVSRADHAPTVGDDVSLMVRPERVEITPLDAISAPDAERTNIVPGKVVALTFRGAHTGVLLDCSGLGLEAEVANIRGEPPHWLTTGSAVRAKVSPAALRLLVS